jgi:putative ATPase
VRAGRKASILFIDEIHRLNKSQQDVLLPHLERGWIRLIGATTENPSFSVNNAIASRCLVFSFRIHTETSLIKILMRAIPPGRNVNPKVLERIAAAAVGDARRALNLLENLLQGVSEGEEVTESAFDEIKHGQSIYYDKHSEAHHDTISAFIKSVRGSDPDAALYWMAKMLIAGEDPRFIARRVMIFASEDVGNADPQALSIATAAARMVEMVGMPEARIPLAQAVAYAASAPKSNAAYLAIDKAMKEVDKGPRREVPNHLKDATLDRDSRGHGQGYLYPHNYPGHHVKQTYMPNRVNLYEPTTEGEEAKIKERLDQWRQKNPS